MSFQSVSPTYLENMHTYFKSKHVKKIGCEHRMGFNHMQEN